MSVKINVSDLRGIIGKLNLAVEKTKLNPKSGWIELETENGNNLNVKVSAFDYYLTVDVPVEYEGNGFHSTVVADTFIPLVSKLEDGDIEAEEVGNALVFKCSTGEYKFPTIKENGIVKQVDQIKFDKENAITSNISGNNLATVADINAKGLVDALFKRDIQQYIFVDHEGAITYAENIFVNEFDVSADVPFKFLLNGTQAKLMKVFDGEENVTVYVGKSDYESPTKIRFESGSVRLTCITQSESLVDKFPYIKLREMASKVSDIHVVIDKRVLDKALGRLMVFDKKFDITVLNYSQLEFGTDGVKLVSVKNGNYEFVPYVSQVNAIEHTSIIRFADLVKRLKVITSSQIDISYGSIPAIIVNSDEVLEMIPENIQK